MKENLGYDWNEKSLDFDLKNCFPNIVSYIKIMCLTVLLTLRICMSST